jgi:hypothetical protein
MELRGALIILLDARETCPGVTSDTGRVDPSVVGTSSPLDETSNFCAIAWKRSVMPIFSTTR